MPLELLSLDPWLVLSSDPQLKPHSRREKVVLGPTRLGVKEKNTHTSQQRAQRASSPTDLPWLHNAKAFAGKARRSSRRFGAL